MHVTHKNGLETASPRILSLGELWSRYIAYWPLYILAVVLAGAGAWMYLRYATPLYQATARILIKDEKKGTDDTKAMESLNLLGTKKIIDNEVEVMQSRTLITEVVKELGLYAPVSVERKIKAVSAYITSPVKIELANLEVVQPSGNIHFTYDDDSRTVQIGQQRFEMNQWSKTPVGFARFVPNPYYKGKQAGKYFFNIVDPDLAGAAIQSRLAVAPVSKPSTILNLTLKDEVPQRSEDILNGLMTAYNRASISDKNTLAANTLSFVEERLQHVAYDLDSIEQRLQSYKSSRSASSLSVQSDLYLKNMSDNVQQLASMQMQMAALDQVDKYVQAPASNMGILPSSLGITDASLEVLLNKMYDYQMEYEKLKKTTARNNPLMVSLSDQIQKIKPLILDNLENKRQSLRANQANLQGTNSHYASSLATLPNKERDVVSLSREQAIRHDIYVFLLKKREETALSYASTVSDSRVVDKAQALLVPVSPNTRLIYIAAIMGTLVLAIVFVTVRETFNTKVLYRQEIENLTFYPVAGEISFSKEKTPIVTGDGKNSIIAEQFRKLRATLDYIGVDDTPARKVLITSTMSGEGKSFVATNLAISLAITGKKVVLMELDLNNPTICTKLNMDAKIGISDYLRGHADPEDIIRPVAGQENLFIVPAGALPKNPSELLINNRLKLIMDYLNNLFDYIIVDTAPAGALTDAYILSKHCDVTLYMIRQKYTPKALVERLNENTKANRLRNLNIVFNSIRTGKFGKNNYGYTYIYESMNKKKGRKMSNV